MKKQDLLKKKLKRINKILNLERITDQEREFIKSLKHFITEYKYLTHNQTKGLYNIYHKYFVNIDKSKKENKSLKDYQNGTTRYIKRVKEVQ